ncbi:MAG: hypothetical protein FGM57_02445 [Candidatus Taylorbacteria bacterium]|nr:hypothetical protein [Candidatus Taylorbacteria bacterium]
MKSIFTKISRKKYLALSLLLVSPKVAAAQILVPIVPQCGSWAGPAQNGGQCGWNDLVQMGQNIIQDAVVFVAMAAVISITYAGYLYATAGGSDSQIKKAHEIFTKVIWGIFFTLGAWLIVYSILDWIGVGAEFYK